MLKLVAVGGIEVRTGGGGVMEDGLNDDAVTPWLAVEVWSSAAPVLGRRMRRCGGCCVHRGSCVCCCAS
jgi:hypothetical protein